MASYFIADDNSVPIMVDDIQQIYAVDDQNFQIILQDMNNGVNGNTNLIAYPTTTVENSEQTIFTSHQAILGQDPTGQFEQGQNVYIINTNDLTLQRSPLKAEQTISQVHTKDNVTKNVRILPKGSLSNTNETQQIQFISMPENNIKNQPVTGRKQTQRTTAATTQLGQGTSGKINQKMPISRSRFTASNMPRAETTQEIKNLGTNSKNVTSTFRLKSPVSSALPSKPSARQPIRPLGASRTPPALHYPSNPPRESLNKRMLYSRMRRFNVKKTVIAPQSSPTIGSNPINKQPLLRPAPARQPRLVMIPAKPIIPVSHTPQSPDIASGNVSYQYTKSSPEKMEIIHSNLSTNKNQQDQSSSKDDVDSTSESFAYLQKIIDNPATAIVQQQITGNTAKMLVVFDTGEQRLVMFNLPTEDCTVQALLELAKIPFNGDTVVSLVKDKIFNINFIVECTAGSIERVLDNSDTINRKTSLTIENSTLQASDDNYSSVTQNDEPKYIDGKLAVCPNCGIGSLDFNRCVRCKKKLPSNVKQFPINSSPQQKKITPISPNNLYKNKANMRSKFQHNSVTKRAIGNKPIIKPCLVNAIDKPASTIVQQQKTGSTVKMLVEVPTGEQRLITFDLPTEDCTVQDVVQHTQIPFNGETVVLSVSDTISNTNSIGESEAGTIVTMRDSSDTSDGETNSTTENSSFQASDDNSNSSLSHNEEPKYIDGKLALCPNCGISSMDFNRCTRCKKKLPSDVKQVPSPYSTPQQTKEAMIAIDNYYKKKTGMMTTFFVYDNANRHDIDSHPITKQHLVNVIDNPAAAIVQQQITDKFVKILVKGLNGKRRLFKFALPNKDCTVQDLLQYIQIPFNDATRVSLVSGHILNINYIVECKAGIQ